MDENKIKLQMDDDRELMNKILRKIAVFYPFWTEGLSENKVAVYEKWQKELSDVIERIDNAQKEISHAEK